MTQATREPRELALPSEAPAVTPDQLDLIRRTVAKDATPDELKLYLYDCARQGVHPLDKLIHFTKRSGKYTPITSIDFMRTRAADTGEMAGSDDPVFEPDFGSNFPKAATVTVYRITQGQRFAYTATARWLEYKPDQDFMWRKLPHTMLGKCAEALALRKGFPRQLAGLYAKEEMDQASVDPASPTATSPALPRAATATDAELGTSIPNVPASGFPDAPPGAVHITEVTSGSGKAVGFLRHSGQHVAQGASNDGLPMYQQSLKALAEACLRDGVPVRLEIVTSTTSGKPYIRSLARVEPQPTDAALDAELARQEQGRVAGEIF